MKLYSDVAVGDTGAVLKDRASYAGGMAISCGTEADMSEPGLPREGDGDFSGLKVDTLGLWAPPRATVSSTSEIFPPPPLVVVVGEPGTLVLPILLPDMVENDVPGRVAVDGRREYSGRPPGVIDNGTFHASARELIVLERRSFGPPSAGRMVGFTDPDDGIGIGAGLGARKDGVSRPPHSSRIEAAAKLGARRVTGLADRDRDTGGPAAAAAAAAAPAAARDEGAVEK